MIVCLWLSLVCSVDSGEVLFERAMSLSPSQAEVVFAEAAESFVDDAASNPHPNVLFNAGLAWAQAGNRPKAKQMLQYKRAARWLKRKPRNKLHEHALIWPGRTEFVHA